MLEDLKIAAVFLTRLPIRLEGGVTLKALADAVYVFPVVGALVGAAGAVVYALAQGFGLPPLAGAVLALATMTAVTGGLHEDGLADTADALGAREDRERALAIMRDSRIGSYGAIALAFALLARTVAYGSLVEVGRFAAVAIAACAASRAVMPAVMLVQPSARASGLAASAGRPQPERVYAGLGLAAALAFLLLPTAGAFKAVAATALAAAALALWLGRRFGGCTGDTLGAIQQAAEVAFLFAVLGAR